MPYEFLEDVAIADIAFTAWGRTLEETFVAAADAVVHAMLEDLEALRLQEERTLHLEDDALDLLLFNTLQELIYYKDAEQLLLRLVRVHITETAGHYALHAEARGEQLDPTRHHLGVDVKAVTLHRFSLEPTDQGWKAFVILDV
jgi:SHS2 domain-containing protein